MRLPFQPLKHHLRRQRGVAAVEFALIAIPLFMFVIGIFEMGRVLFYYNTAGEVTAIGARMAVVCDINDPQIKEKMRSMLTILDNDNDIILSYQPAGCSAGTCISATVEIAGGVTINTVIPFMPQTLTVTLPPFRTQLRRESLMSANNPVC